MAGSVQFKLDDREFRRTLDVYKNKTRRDRPVIVNTKSFYIARAAVYYTPKADTQKVTSELRGDRLKAKSLKSGKVKNVPYTLAQLIVLARRAAHGLATSRTELNQAAKALINARRKSVAFLKSGWLPAIKGLQNLAERPGSAKPMDRKTEQIGAAKGKVKPARDGMVTTYAVITNLADARYDTKAALLKYGGPGLQAAIDHETASMNEYIERKLRDRAHEAGIKTH